MDQVYWDVFPKSIKVSKGYSPVTVPLTVRGNPRGVVQFESNDPTFASVSPEGVVSLGVYVGAGEIMAFDSLDRDSVRCLRVEVADYAKFDVS